MMSVELNWSRNIVRSQQFDQNCPEKKKIEIKLKKFSVQEFLNSVSRNKDVRLDEIYGEKKEKKKFLIEASGSNKIEENFRRVNSALEWTLRWKK